MAYDLGESDIQLVSEFYGLRRKRLSQLAISELPIHKQKPAHEDEHQPSDGHGK